MNTLFIDTTSNREIIVNLTIGEDIFEEKREIKNNRTQVVLPLVKLLLREHNLTPQDVEKISIHPGPGSFTGIRVGAAIANALIFALKIPQQLIEPIYS